MLLLGEPETLLCPYNPVWTLILAQRNIFSIKAMYAFYLLSTYLEYLTSDKNLYPFVIFILWWMQTTRAVGF